ncbi:MAG TPA: hypothetical protein VGN81_29745 [Pseudonocardiaceae bacterium]
MFGLLGAAEDFFGGGPQHFVGDAEGAFASAVVAVDGIGGELAVVDGVGEDAAEEADDAFDCGVFVAGGVEVGGPLADVAGDEFVEEGGAEARPDVPVDEAAVVVTSSRSRVAHQRGSQVLRVICPRLGS